jgi:hypothetical protein
MRICCPSFFGRAGRYEMEDWVYLCEKEIKKEADLRNIRGLKRISSYLIHLLIKTYEKIGNLKATPKTR